MGWCHQESNRGHKDFQSFALPTELWHLLVCECKGTKNFCIRKLLEDFFQKYFLILYFNGFQPCAFNSNSLPSRQISAQPSSGFVM